MMSDFPTPERKEPVTWREILGIAMFVGAILLVLTLLPACTTIPTVVSTCGTLTPFSKDWQHKLAIELSGVPETDPVYQAVKDLKRMRDEARGCQEASR